MLKHFEMLDDCPIQLAPVVLAGATITTHSNVVTAVSWCARTRLCEQEHGSLLDIPGCRMHDTSTIELRAVKPASKPAAPSAIRVVVSAGISDLIPGFIDNRRQEAKRLAAAATAGDFSTIDQIGQRMVGGGAMFGFDDITALGRMLCSAARKKNARDVLDTVSAYERYLAMVQVEFGDAANASRYAMTPISP